MGKRKSKSKSKSGVDKKIHKNSRSSCPSSSCDCSSKDPRDMTKDELVRLCYPSDRPQARRLVEKLRTYLIQLNESDGFDVDVFPGSFNGITSIVPVKYDEAATQDPADHFSLAQMSIAIYNAENSETEFEAIKVERVNVNTFGNVVQYYITFHARDVKTGDVKTFQSISRIGRDISGEPRALLCHLKPS